MPTKTSPKLRNLCNHKHRLPSVSNLNLCNQAQTTIHVTSMYRISNLNLCNLAQTTIYVTKHRYIEFPYILNLCNQAQITIYVSTDRISITDCSIQPVF